MLVFIFVNRVNITEDGKQALLRLAKGDMRRALNILQATHAAFDLVNENNVYSCTQYYIIFIHFIDVLQRRHGQPDAARH